MIARGSNKEMWWNQIGLDTKGPKGVGRVYQQTFIDTYAKVAFAKLYDRKTPITAADVKLPRFRGHPIF